MRLERRRFLQALTGSAFAGLLGACSPSQQGQARAALPAYGRLVSDPQGLLDLPAGFRYRVIASFGERMDDGFVLPDNFDGMGCFPLDERRVVLVRNHELKADQQAAGPVFGDGHAKVSAYDRTTRGEVLPGGTTSLTYDLMSGKVEAQHLSLVGTIRNCAGGATPWGSWLSCEEDVTRAGEGVSRDHGWVFEVPAAARRLATPVPLTAMGRFNHEAVTVDPRTGIVYLTEDRDDSLLYRFLPNAKDDLSRGGRLQALALVESGLIDSRNWNGIGLSQGNWQATRWIDLDGVESPGDDLRWRGHAHGALLFARGEGIHFGDGEFYFCCTSGGTARLGQIMRYRPSRFEGQPEERSEPGQLQSFVESTNAADLDFGDNLTVAPNGHLIICEDQYTDTAVNHLRGITPAGEIYTFAKLKVQTELAGACFSPDGRTLFVNVFSPGKTLAITGPWAAFAHS